MNITVKNTVNITIPSFSYKENIKPQIADTVNATLTADISDEFQYPETYVDVSNVQVLVDGVSIPFTLEGRDIVFQTTQDITPDQDIEIRFTTPSDFEFNSVVLSDETYDKNLAFNIDIVSDNNSLIRGVDVADSYYDNKLKLVSDELGVMANTFENIFENSQFGKAYKFLHTSKLYGSGYDIEMYYEDSSKVKWTLETIGVTYKMRRTRSR